MRSVVNFSIKKQYLRKIRTRIHDSFTVFVCALIGFQPLMAEMAIAQQIVIDPNGNVGFTPSVRTQNNRQVVDIATPNSGGVSLNQYSEFSVGNNGAVLNNSQTGANSRLAGNVSGNANLSGGTAGTIVNEVTSSNGSVLTGAVEVAGDKADVIIANPNGINCNGCYFINTGDGTLTTGVPTISGSTVSVDVTQGAITIGRRGLRGEAGFHGAADNINLIGRTVIVDGRVSAVDGVNVQGGAQTYDVTNGRRTATLTGQGTVPNYAIDATAYGAMQAGRIQIIGNERGLGVRALGAVTASNSSTIIRSEGDATVRSVNSARNVDLRANYGTLTLERDIASTTGTIYAYARQHIRTTDRTGLYGADKVTLYARNNNLSYDGVLQSGGDVSIYARRTVDFTAYGVAAGDMTLRGGTAVNLTDATIVANQVSSTIRGNAFTIDSSAVFSGADFAIATTHFTLGSNVVVEGRDTTETSRLVVDATGDFTNGADQRRIDTSAITYAGNLINAEGGYIEAATLRLADGRTITNSGVLSGTTSVDLRPAAFINNDTGVVIGDRVKIDAAGALTNNGQIIADGDALLYADTTLANNGVVQGTRAFLTAPVVIQSGTGATRGQTYVKVDAATSFTNDGQLTSQSTLLTLTGALTNDGLIASDTNIDLRTTTLTNNGLITAGQSIVLRATGKLRNDGDLISYRNMTLMSDESVENRGKIIADNGFSITGPWFQNLGDDALVRTNGGGIRAARIRNSGQIYMIGEMSRSGDLDFFENTGTFATQSRLRITGRDANSQFINRAGGVILIGLQGDDVDQDLLSTGYASLNVATLTMDGHMATGGGLTLQGPAHLSINGKLNAGGNLSLLGDNISVGSNAELQADGAFFATTAGRFTNNGAVAANGYARVQGGITEFINNGYFAASSTSRFTVDGAFTNAGVFQTASSATVRARTISNTGYIQSGGHLSLLAEWIATVDGVTTSTRGTLRSTGVIAADLNVALTGAYVGLEPTSYLTGAQLRVAADRFFARGRAVMTGTSRNDWTIAQDFRQYGTTYSKGALRITADSFLGYADSQLSSEDYVTLTTVGNASFSGAVIANALTVTAGSTSAGTTGSLFSANDLRLTAANGRVYTAGETLAGGNLLITSEYFDLRGDLYAENVTATAKDTRSYVRGNVYAGNTATLTVNNNYLYNYGLIEATEKVSIVGNGVSIAAGAEVAGTVVDIRSTNGLVNAGRIFGAYQGNLRATGTFINQATGVVDGVSVAVTAQNFDNSGTIDVYGFFGDIGDRTRNYGTLHTEAYLGLDSARIENRAGATLQSDDHLYIKTSGTTTNYDGATIQAKVADLRVRALNNHGVLRGDEVVNVANAAASVNNGATGKIYGETIALYAGTWFANDGVVGQRASSALPRTTEVYIAADDNARNGGSVESQKINVLAGSVSNTGTMRASGGTLGLKANASWIGSNGDLFGRDIVLEARTGVDLRATTKAGESIVISAGSTVKNRIENESTPEILAKRIVISAGDQISNHGRIFGYESLGMESLNDDIYNNGNITGPEITLIASRGGVWSPAAITSGGTLAIEARSIGLRQRVRVTDQVTLKTTHYDVEVNDRIETRRLLVDAARDIKAGNAAFRGSALTQLVGNDILRTDNLANAKLRTIYGARGDIYVEMRNGSFGTMGPSIYESAGHGYDYANFDVTGSIAIKANAGHALIRGTFRADDDIFVDAAKNTVLGNTTLDAGGVLHLEGGQFLKKYGSVNLAVGDKLELIAQSGWFYTGDWLPSRDINYHVSAQASTISVNSDHRFVNHDVFLVARNDIWQTNNVISARQLTYSAGRDIRVRFSPFRWRADNTDAAYTGDWWDVDSAGLRGNSLLSQGRGMVLYAGRDIHLKSGKVHSGGAMSITAGRDLLSEPLYLETKRWNRPGNVGWSFDSRYTGVQSGHDASKVDLVELRAYENQITARNDLTILVGGTASFIGTKIQSTYGDISIEARLGRVNMVAAPGFWNYNYRNTTTKKKFFGLYRRTTTYEFDAAEDIYKRAQVIANRGSIDVLAAGSDPDYAAIISAGTHFQASGNISLRTPNGNITSGTYAERSVQREETHSSTKIFFFIPFGSSDTEETNSILINYGSDFFSDETLTLSAPRGTLTLTNGTIQARTVNITAARLEIKTAIDSARNTYYSRKDNMITITTIQSGFERETANLPQITADNINFTISGETHISGYRGATLNSQLINLIGSRQFSDETLNLVAPAEVDDAEAEAETRREEDFRDFVLPGADDGAQFSYLDTLVQDFDAEYHTISLRDREWYDKQVQLNPAFKALLQAAVGYVTGGLGINLGSAFINAGVEAATTSLIVGVVEGTITGEFDMDDILRGAFLAGASTAISSFLTDQIDFGAGLSDQSPFANDVRGTFTPAAFVDRLGDRIVNQVVTNVVYGQDPFEGFDNLGRTFLVSEVLALAQFGVGELGEGSDTQWEGSLGHILLHGGLGCVALEVMDGDCVSGFFTGASSAILAGSDLTDEQKLELAPLVGAFSGFFTSGGNPINVSFGSTVSHSAVVNNYLTHAEALRRAQVDAELAACERDNDCSQDVIAALQSELAALNALDDQRDQNLISACTADPDGSQCLALINELAIAIQLYQGESDPFNLGALANTFILDYRNAHLGVASGDLNGVSSAMLAEQQSSLDLLDRFSTSFQLVQDARFQENLMLLSADALMGLAGAGLVRLQNGAVRPTSGVRNTLPAAQNITEAQWRTARENGIDPRYVTPEGRVIYPDATNSAFDNGFGTAPTTRPMTVGETFDRYGGYYENGVFRDTGAYGAQVGTDFSARALPLSTGNRPFVEYRVVREIPNVQVGPTAPWFGQSGGGTQYFFGDTRSINYLLDNNYIEIVRITD